MPTGTPPSRPPAPNEPESVPILPLRNSVLFPMSVVPINVGRQRSVRLVEDLLGRDRALVGVLSQRSPDVDEPGFKELFTVGTIARVVKVIRLGPSNYSVVLNGLGRFRVKNLASLEPYMRAKIERIPESLVRDVELDALGAALRESTREVLGLMPNLPRDTAGILDNVREPGALADLIASNFPQAQASVGDKQEILEAFDVKARVRLVMQMVGRQLEVLRVKKEISSMVQEEMGKSQREYILRQQMKSIKEELGEGADDDEVEELRERIRRAKVPPEVEKVAKKQLSRLRSMAPQSAEFNVTRTYLEWIGDLPWSKTTVDKLSVADVRRCLDEDHLGLEKVKKRIVEYAAIRQLRADKKGPILLFIGPPGVGKTSLGKSIARAMGRRYERIALGGVRDEAEIRGHRRTYVGALPGRILQALKKAGTKNPVLVLDEVDKMGVDLRGDPAAALLEVLDPEQNGTFQDHYLDLPFDLSQVMFLATANNRDGIPTPLYDRMEVIEVAGYTRTDKLGIAREFLVPKQLSAHGLTDERLAFPEPGIASLIDHYTREAGVRGLEREIASVCRSTAVKVAEGNDVHEVATAEHIEQVLGPHKHRVELAERDLAPGVATGRRRHPLHRGLADAGQGQRRAHRQHAQRDAGVGEHGRLVRAQQGGAPPPRPGVAEDHRPARAHPPARHAQGRPQCRRDHVHRGGVAPPRLPGEERHRHDRRDLPARPGPARRRHQGEAARGAPRRDQARAHAGEEPARSRRRTAGHQGRPADHAGGAARRDPAAGAAAAARDDAFDAAAGGAGGGGRRRSAVR
jgi:ATP-dependent Lon protease